MAEPDLAVDSKSSEAVSRIVDDTAAAFVVLMVDPDAPSPDAPTAGNILHWLAADMRATTAAQDFGPLKGQSVLTNSTPNAVPFAPPGPPPASAAHRYVLYAFEQPEEEFELPEEFAQFSATNRAMFDLEGFIEAAGLGEPVAANFLFVSRQEAVPGTFVAAPGGEFPGGNGNAVGLGGGGGGGANNGDNEGGGEGGDNGDDEGGGEGGDNGDNEGGGNGDNEDAKNNGTGVMQPAGGANDTGMMGEGAVGEIIVIEGVGQMATGMGVLNADGSCTCNAQCPSGSFPDVTVQK